MTRAEDRDLADTIALSWVTSLYARYGSDEQLEGCYRMWHRGREALPTLALPRPVSWRPDVGWKWLKWTVGFWIDPANRTFFGIDLGPLEIVWRLPGYRP